MDRKITIKYKLSSMGQKKAFADGLDASYEQILAVDYDEALLPYCKIDFNGVAEIDLFKMPYDYQYIDRRNCTVDDMMNRQARAVNGKLFDEVLDAEKAKKWIIGSDERLRQCKEEVIARGRAFERKASREAFIVLTVVFVILGLVWWFF
jgi:hypothetical protein